MPQVNLYFGPNSEREGSPIRTSPLSEERPHHPLLLQPEHFTKNWMETDESTGAVRMPHGEAAAVHLESNAGYREDKAPSKTGGLAHALGTVQARTPIRQYTDLHPHPQHGWEEHLHLGTPQGAVSPHFAESVHTASEEWQENHDRTWPGYQIPESLTRGGIHTGLTNLSRAAPKMQGRYSRMNARRAALGASEVEWQTPDYVRSTIAWPMNKLEATVHDEDFARPTNIRIEEHDPPASGTTPDSAMEEDYDATNTGRVFNLRGDAGPHKNQMLGRMATEHYEHDTHPEGILDIHYVETHPSYRGMGLGSQMIEHAKRHLNQTTGTRGTTTTASTGFTSEGMAYLHGKGHIQYGTMPSSVAGKVGWSKYDPGYEDDWV